MFALINVVQSWKRLRFESVRGLLLLLLLLLPVRPACAATLSEIDAQIAAEEKRRKSMDKKIDEQRKKIKQMNVKASNLLGKIDSMRQGIQDAQEKMSAVEQQTSKLQKSVRQLNNEIADTDNQIGQLSRALKNRLVEMYKYGTTEGLQLIFAAEDTQQVLDSVYLLDRLAKHDQFLIEELQNKKQKIELSKQTLVDHTARLKAQTKVLAVQKQKYNSSIQQTNSFLNDIRRQKGLAEKAAREMEQAQVAVGQTIVSLMRQKKEAAERSSGGHYKGGVDYLVGRGRGNMFDWPLRGPLTSPFGPRIHPVFKTKSFHSGLDIGAPRGTPIRAAAPGEVLYSGWMRGYGQVVIVDHGRNYSTVYAHMSSTRVKEGNIVKTGTVIGAVGNTGTATGYHLHFEVRIGSSAKSPLNYLKR